VAATSAAVAARAYRGNSFTDWYLPSKDELNALYLQRTTVGGLAGGYWSSSEERNSHAWGQDFNNGSQGAGDKFLGNVVRPIRAF
jgi:hypothetical protein